MTVQVIAQIVEEAAALKPLYASGVVGVVIGFFMLLTYRMFLGMRQDNRAYRSDNAALLVEIRKLGHHFRALEIALLFEAASRPNCQPNIKDYADRKIARSDRDMNTVDKP